MPGAPGCTKDCASADKVAPKLSFRAPSRRTLKALLKSGITLRVKCNEACKISGVLDLRVTVRTKSKGKRVRKLRVYVVGRSKTASTSQANKAVTIRVKLTLLGQEAAAPCQAEAGAAHADGARRGRQQALGGAHHQGPQALASQPASRPSSSTARTSAGGATMT